MHDLMLDYPTLTVFIGLLVSLSLLALAAYIPNRI